MGCTILAVKGLIYEGQAGLEIYRTTILEIVFEYLVLRAGHSENTSIDQNRHRQDLPTRLDV